MTNTPQEQPRKEITAEEFIKIWKGDYKKGNFKFSDKYNTFYKVDVHGNDYVHFELCKVPSVFLDSSYCSVLFENCDLQKIKMQDAKLGDISFKNTIVNDSITIYDTSTGNIQVNNCSLQSFDIYNSNINWLNVREARIEFLDIYYRNKIGDISFCALDTRSILFEGSVLNRVKIEDTKTNELSFIESNIKEITLNKQSVINTLRFDFCNVESKKVIISDIHLAYLKINMISALNILIGGEKKTILGMLDLKNIILLESSHLHLINVDINRVRIESFVNKGTIIFNKLNPTNKILRVAMDNKKHSRPIITSNGSYKTNQKNQPSSIEIINSDLGNSHFIGCNMYSFNHFIFKNSNILGIFVADTKFPLRTQISTNNGDQNTQRRLVLSQIKKVFENQGDTVLASHYRASEMRVYREQLNFPQQLGTWLIVSLSRETSKFGQSIFRPLFWLFCGHYLLFMLAIGFNAFEWNEVGELWYYFFYLANPIRTYIFQTDWTILIDILMRVWSSYMIYNFIRASRRFIK